MTAIPRLLGRDREFFELLAIGAAEACSGAKRVDHKRISNEITEAPCKQFYTPLEREDIEHLSDALYKISQTVEKIAERLSIAPSMGHLPTIKNKWLCSNAGRRSLRKC